jgi:hypothetical protein
LLYEGREKKLERALFYGCYHLTKVWFTVIISL